MSKEVYMPQSQKSVHDFCKGKTIESIKHSKSKIFYSKSKFVGSKVKNTGDVNEQVESQLKMIDQGIQTIHNDNSEHCLDLLNKIENLISQSNATSDLIEGYNIAKELVNKEMLTIDNKKKEMISQIESYEIYNQRLGNESYYLNTKLRESIEVASYHNKELLEIMTELRKHIDINQDEVLYKESINLPEQFFSNTPNFFDSEKTSKKSQLNLTKQHYEKKEVPRCFSEKSEVELFGDNEDSFPDWSDSNFQN